MHILLYISIPNIFMGLLEKEIEIWDKRSTIHFCCPPNLKSDWIAAEAALGQYNTNTASLMAYMNERIAKWKEMINHV